MTNRITLIRTQDGWLADFEDDASIRAAFGTTCIPTAFTARAGSIFVQARIQQLNPQAIVRVQS